MKADHNSRLPDAQTASCLRELGWEVSLEDESLLAMLRNPLLVLSLVDDTAIIRRRYMPLNHFMELAEFLYMPHVKQPSIEATNF